MIPKLNIGRVIFDWVSQDQDQSNHNSQSEHRFTSRRANESSSCLWRWEEEDNQVALEASFESENLIGRKDRDNFFRQS